jgi:hypothetical protein
LSRPPNKINRSNELVQEESRRRANAANLGLATCLSSEERGRVACRSSHTESFSLADRDLAQPRVLSRALGFCSRAGSGKPHCQRNRPRPRPRTLAHLSLGPISARRTRITFIRWQHPPSTTPKWPRWPHNLLPCSNTKCSNSKCRPASRASRGETGRHLPRYQQRTTASRPRYVLPRFFVLRLLAAYGAALQRMVLLCSDVAPDRCMDLSLAGCHSNQGEQF